jgi:hypothetical protein
MISSRFDRRGRNCAYLWHALKYGRFSVKMVPRVAPKYHHSQEAACLTWRAAMRRTVDRNAKAGVRLIMSVYKLFKICAAWGF